MPDDKNSTKNSENSVENSTPETENSENSVENSENSENLISSPAMATCKKCGERMPRTLIPAHYWERHRDEQMQAHHEGLEKHREEKPPSDKVPLKEKDPPPTGLKEISDLRSRMVPARLYSDTHSTVTSVLDIGESITKL